MSRTGTTTRAKQRQAQTVWDTLDYSLLLTALALLGIGWVFVTSASLHIADRNTGFAFYFSVRQAIYIGLGVAVSMAVWRIPLQTWQRHGTTFLFLGLALLLLVLIPGIGKDVNGSIRWISLGPANVQVSEIYKLAFIVFMAGYLVRRQNEVCEGFKGFVKPMALLGVGGVLLLAEPDFGAMVVLVMVTGGMLFLAGARLWHFAGLISVVAVLFGVLIWTAPYRLVRVTAFMDPWADPFNTGFQLTHALIAFGQGEWFGTGLGGGVQKIFYLPEAHTDFVFSVLAEETGLLGTLTVIGLFSFLVWRAFGIGVRAFNARIFYGAWLAYGIGLMFAFQAFVNMGVNMGILPTKGLTLPLMSYGGSSMIISCVSIALLLRIDYETALEIGTSRWVRK